MKIDNFLKDKTRILKWSRWISDETFKAIVYAYRNPLATLQPVFNANSSLTVMIEAKLSSKIKLQVRDYNLYNYFPEKNK